MNSSQKRKGIVLFLVLSIMAAVAAFLFSVFYLSNTTYQKTEGLKDYTTAYHAAVSAVKIALKYLRQDNNGFDGKGDDWAEPIAYNYRGIFISIRINDECGKFNVNKLTLPLYYRIGKRLFEDLGKPEVVDAIKDWIDGDDIPSPFGAEKDYYESMGYRPSNRPMKSLGELLYVKGIDEKTFKKIEPYITVYGNGKVNVNSAPKKVLVALSDRMSDEAANSIIEARPIKKLEALRELPGIDQELYYEILPLITNRCNYFRITVTASYGSSTVSLVAYTTRNRILEWKVVE